MKDEAQELSQTLMAKYGDKLQFTFVDVSTDEIKSYPKVMEILNRVRLPLTVVNGEPRFHGGLAADMISDAIDNTLAKS